MNRFPTPRLRHLPVRRVSSFSSLIKRHHLPHRHKHVPERQNAVLKLGCLSVSGASTKLLTKVAHTKNVPDPSTHVLPSQWPQTLCLLSPAPPVPPTRFQHTSPGGRRPVSSCVGGLPLGVSCALTCWGMPLGVLGVLACSGPQEQFLGGAAGFPSTRGLPVLTAHQPSRRAHRPLRTHPSSPTPQAELWFPTDRHFVTSP